MFQVSHILVLSQPDFVESQVCSVLKSSAPEPAEEFPPLREAPRPERKLKPRGSRVRW